MNARTREQLLDIEGIDAGDIVAIGRAAAAGSLTDRIERQVADAATGREGRPAIAVRTVACYKENEKLLEYETRRVRTHEQPQRIHILIETRREDGAHETTTLEADLAFRREHDRCTGTTERTPVVTDNSKVTVQELTELLKTAYGPNSVGTKRWSARDCEHSAQMALIKPATRSSLNIEVQLCVRIPGGRRKKWSAHATAYLRGAEVTRQETAETYGENAAKAAAHATEAAVAALLAKTTGTRLQVGPWP